jgi:Uma2 family endonuclease
MSQWRDAGFFASVHDPAPFQPSLSSLAILCAAWQCSPMLTLTSTTALPAADWDDVIYPDSDGLPMANNQLHFSWIRYLYDILEIHFEGQSDEVTLLADVLWYPVQGDSGVCVAPDVMLAFGRPQLPARGSYRQWIEDDIPPQVVFEILSPGNTTAEMRAKLSFFDKHDVEEYYLYDCEKVTLRAYIRDKVNGRLRELHSTKAWLSPRLGVRFDITTGRLRLITPDGHTLANGIEKARQADAKAEAERRKAREADAKAEAERLKTREADAKAESERLKARKADAKAESERLKAREADAKAESERLKAREADAKAESERLRAEKLTALLRAAGIDPDELA